MDMAHATWIDFLGLLGAVCSVRNCACYAASQGYSLISPWILLGKTGIFGPGNYASRGISHGVGGSMYRDKVGGNTLVEKNSINDHVTKNKWGGISGGLLRSDVGAVGS